MAQFPIVESVTIPNATPSADGLMSSADKTKLDGISPGAGGGGTAATTTSTPVGNVSATNVQAAIQELDSEKADAGAVSAALGAKADTAAVNAALATLDANKVSNQQLADGLAGKSNVGHTHQIADVSNLQTVLDNKALASDVATQFANQQVAINGKAAAVHTHTTSEVTNLLPMLLGSSNIDATGKPLASFGVDGLPVLTWVNTSSPVQVWQKQAGAWVFIRNFS